MGVRSMSFLISFDPLNTHYHLVPSSLLLKWYVELASYHSPDPNPTLN